jgi:hypothetical protein
MMGTIGSKHMGTMGTKHMGTMGTKTYGKSTSLLHNFVLYGRFKLQTMNFPY